MIPKIQASGKSFKGLATYLTRDPKAETKERVAWTHTLNLAHDDALSAVDEMMLTARNAELLKQEAGIRAGGRETESPVKHFSLNWSPQDKPTREHMIETTQDFLVHMGWQERQALLVAHNDKPYAHVHVMLNAIHPETGLKLDESFEQRRAQKWALDYEREQGRIYCEQRLQNVEDREDGPTRPAWTAFEKRQQEFEIAEKTRRDQEPILIRDAEIPKNPEAEEWKALKQSQRDSRMDFMADGKSVFSELRLSIYREVREEFRERWSDFYTARENGADDKALATLKAELVADQKAVLDARRDAACDELRTARDSQYRELLSDQREDRLGLRWRQEAGLDNAPCFEQLENRDERKDITAAFGEAGAEKTGRPETSPWEPETPEFGGRFERDGSGMRSGADIGANLGTGIGFGLLSIFESVADGIIGAKPAPKPRQSEPDPPRPNPFDAVVADARRRQQREQEEVDEEYRRKQRSFDRE